MPILILGGLAIALFVFSQKSAKPDRGAWQVRKPNTPLPKVPAVGDTVRFLAAYKNGGYAVLEGKIFEISTLNPLDPDVFVNAERWLVKEGLLVPNPPIPSQWTIHVSDFSA